MRECAEHPTQPLVRDHDGTVRFKHNAIVQYLLDNGGIDLNQLAMRDFSHEDHVQFAQLIGYSESGFSELWYVSDAAYERATAEGRGRAIPGDAVPRTLFDEARDLVARAASIAREIESCEDADSAMAELEDFELDASDFLRRHPSGD